MVTPWRVECGGAILNDKGEVVAQAAEGASAEFIATVIVHCVNAFGEQHERRDTLIKAARSWLRWIEEPAAVAGREQIRQFAETVLRTLDADRSNG